MEIPNYGVGNENSSSGNINSNINSNNWLYRASFIFKLLGLFLFLLFAVLAVGELVSETYHQVETNPKGCFCQLPLKHPDHLLEDV